MAVWGTLFLLAVAGTSVLAEDRGTFPEVARAAGSRIVSGWEAKEGQFPHQFSLRMINPIGQVFACGGSVISSGWGLTAAHCTAGRISFVIRAGVVNLTRPGIIFETTDFYNHPLYNNNLPGVVQPNDIGLLRFNRDLEFSDTIQPIRLQRTADRDINYAGVISIASGWGNTWTQGTSPENLNWVYLTLTSNAACWAAFGFSSIIQPSTICAASYNVTSQSTCQGDSGGPLTIVEDDGITTQVGVTSFVSSSGCHTDIPAGFIRTGYYHDWYTDVTGIDFEGLYTTTSTTEAVSTVTSPEETTQPEDTTTEAAPEDTTSVAPEDTTTEAAPEDTTPAAPEDSTTEAAPEDTTVVDPETTTTEVAPEDTTSAAPEDTTTEAAPEDTTVVDPEETTTEAAPEDTTSAPEDTTTEAAPEESTTEAATTAEPEDSSESSESSESSSSSEESEED
ncbi:collagenase-like [Trichoplusia ni]|uniref:Collagenase-like n=1 Tax=Trichoplusia ni TaxID=7111 RepID=A0A7E5VQI0_TRINI|nr:collagenase-like [Trichoplusia ni]